MDEKKIPTCSNSALYEIRFQDLITTSKKQVIFKSLKLTHPKERLSYQPKSVVYVLTFMALICTLKGRAL